MDLFPSAVMHLAIYLFSGLFQMCVVSGSNKWIWSLGSCDLFLLQVISYAERVSRMPATRSLRVGNFIVSRRQVRPRHIKYFGGCILCDEDQFLQSNVEIALSSNEFRYFDCGRTKTYASSEQRVCDTYCRRNTSVFCLFSFSQCTFTPTNPDTDNQSFHGSADLEISQLWCRSQVIWLHIYKLVPFLCFKFTPFPPLICQAWRSTTAVPFTNSTSSDI
ncbi:hypothetical protein BJ138DRAFT_261724 [Hygrophoropsis aurantiaca]|uniref:Uncharacterized protein n=1 Tax=Hygrophoropsis aurantiaca TaxID=72124 RepID=A0ACB8A812_9AGAM|nr:hypothetical protein BJ138DRAFT_261724 [Hygrophoropsis aurantiaca]